MSDRLIVETSGIIFKNLATHTFITANLHYDAQTSTNPDFNIRPGTS